MGKALVSIEDLPPSRFHKRIALVAAGGPFCDGYLLGIIVVALPFIAKDLALNALQIGLIGASSLIGMFAGGLVFGPVTDRFGRQKMYVLNLAVFVICSLAHLFVHDVTTLFILRFVMGVALGADYPIATALAAEFLPRKLRGPVLASLVLLLWVGYTISLATGLIVSGSDSGVWRYILASAAIPSAIFLLLRLNIPESPRWLISAGRVEAARSIVAQHLGPQVDFDALVAETRVSTSRRGLGLSKIRELLSRGYGRMLVFLLDLLDVSDCAFVRNQDVSTDAIEIARRHSATRRLARDHFICHRRNCDRHVGRQPRRSAHALSGLFRSCNARAFSSGNADVEHCHGCDRFVRSLHGGRSCRLRAAIHLPERDFSD
ncbi:hypothetical protein QFZ96_000295 [Paraburkholderia youngii]